MSIFGQILENTENNKEVNQKSDSGLFSSIMSDLKTLVPSFDAGTKSSASFLPELILDDSTTPSKHTLGDLTKSVPNILNSVSDITKL